MTLHRVSNIGDAGSVKLKSLICIRTSANGSPSEIDCAILMRNENYANCKKRKLNGNAVRLSVVLIGKK